MIEHGEEENFEGRCDDLSKLSYLNFQNPRNTHLAVVLSLSVEFADRVMISETENSRPKATKSIRDEYQRSLLNMDLLADKIDLLTFDPTWAANRTSLFNCSAVHL